MYLDRYWSALEIILSTDCYRGRCFRQSFIRSTKSRNILWQSIEFEETYLQRLQKLLFLTAAIACYPTFSAVWRSKNSAPSFPRVPAGLLQLAVSGAAGMWYQSTTVGSECSWTTVRWRIQIWFRGSCVARWPPLAASQAENHFQGRGVRIQGHPWPRASSLEGTICSRVKCSGIESKQICIPWRLHRSTQTRNTTYRQQSFAVAGPTWWNYFPLKSATSVPCKLSVPDLRQFYLESLTTSLPYNRTVCFSWILADLWTFTIIYTVSDLPCVMRLGMLAWL